MTKTVWHKGPPPEIGWWPASVSGDRKSIRWYDGNEWSDVAYPRDSASQAAECADRRIPFYAQKLIKWTDRWWL